MNKKSREGTVQELTEKFYMGFRIAAREIILQSKIRDEEIIGEAELLAIIHYTATVGAARIIALGENKSELLSQIAFLLEKTTDTRVKMGVKKLNEDMSEAQN